MEKRLLSSIRQREAHRCDIKSDCPDGHRPVMKRYFTTGLLVLLPVAASVWVIAWMAEWVYTSILRRIFETGLIQLLLEPYPASLQPWLGGLIGLIIVFLGVSFLGMLATNVVGKWLLSLVDWFFKRVPLASTVYNFVQGVIESFNRARSGYFEKVVAIEYPRRDVWSIGFLSRRVAGRLTQMLPGDQMVVFVPTAPNPTTGFIAIVEASQVRVLDMTPEEGLKFIVSGGVLMPGAAREKEQ